MFDLITEHKGAFAILATIIATNVGFYVLYNIRSNKNCDQLRKSEKIYDDDGKELKRLPYHKFLFTLLQDQKVKDLYLKRSHIIRDLFEIPQKELTNVEYDKENDTVKFNDKEKCVDDILSVTVYKIDYSATGQNTQQNQQDSPIIVKMTERINKGYLIPFVEFTKQAILPAEVQEAIVKGLNDYLAKQNVSINQKLNTAINIAKAIEYLLFKGIPFETLKLDWSNDQLLNLLEQLGSTMPKNKFDISINLRIPEVICLSLSLKFKKCLFGGCGDVDAAVAEELKNYVKANPLGDDPASTVISSFSNQVIPLIDETSKKDE